MSKPLTVTSHVDAHELAAVVHDVHVERAVADLLTHLGEDPTRDGLLKTPERVRRAWVEMTRGYREDPAEILGTSFSQDDEDVTPYDGMVVLRGIEFFSNCEHHMLPFVGQAHLVYIPNEDGRIVGISKLARVVDCFARRLQVQERMTSQIADALQAHLAPHGVMVVLEAVHYCMKLRGVCKQNSSMVTSALRGVFHDDLAAREEALRLIRD